MSKSLVLYDSYDLRIENQPIQAVGDNEAKIKICSVGVCGSDVTLWKNNGIGNEKNVRPLRIGHEPAGIVQEVGINVRNIKPGDRVAVEPLIPCRECRFCKIGKCSICTCFKYIGGIDTDGALSEYHVQSAFCCYKIADSMSFDEGALVQPLSIAVGICKLAEISFGQKVVIGGAGPIGILCMMVAKACGASRVCVTDILEERLTFGKNKGADCAVVVRKDDSPQTTSNRVIEELGDLADVSIDCCGISSSIESLMKATIDGGVLTLVGLAGGTISAQNIALKNLQVRGYCRTYNNYPTAINLIKTGQVNVSSLITHRYYIDDFQKAFDNMVDGIGIKHVIYL